MKNSTKSVLVVFCALLAWQAGQTAYAAEPPVTIATPERDGVSVGCDSTVGGTAELKPGQHVWVFAARENFAKLGLLWPQGEAEVNPATKKWSLTTAYGEGGDIGHSFRIVAAVFDDQADAKLKAGFIKAMTAGKSTPIQLPETAGEPAFRTVKKVSHDNCSH